MELDEAVRLHPDAHFACVMLILGIRFAELSPDHQKFKARIVLRGDQIQDSEGVAA